MKRKEQWKEYYNKKPKLVEVNNDAVQIQITKEQMERRNLILIEKKQELNNESNNREFIDILDDSNDVLCARSNTKNIHRSSQIKVSRLNYTDDSFSNNKNNNKENKINNGVEERMECIEEHLNIVNPFPTDIYLRIKYLEDLLIKNETIINSNNINASNNNNNVNYSEHKEGINNIDKDEEMKLPITSNSNNNNNNKKKAKTKGGTNKREINNNSNNNNNNNNNGNNSNDKTIVPEVRVAIAPSIEDVSRYIYILSLKHI